MINANDPNALRGWAIPAATDIAFAPGILALLGSRVPVALKVFLLAVAIIDDLAAIIIIAVFYTSELSMTALGVSALGVTALAALNVWGVRRLTPYLLVGTIVWVFRLKSGVHATLAGVAAAVFVPNQRLRARDKHTVLLTAEHDLKPWVLLGIMPIFAFTNAGVDLRAIPLEALFGPVSLGIAAGLFIGKQIGILGFVWAAVATGAARLPSGVTWQQMHGVALLAGIGFTMSLFIGTLAFAAPDQAAAVRVGVLAGSLASGIVGYLVLLRSVGATSHMLATGRPPNGLDQTKFSPACASGLASPHFQYEASRVHICRRRSSMAEYDVVIRGGTVATATDTFESDVAISGEVIAALGRNLPQGRKEIDARGKLVLPGGVDGHAHIEQLSGMGVMNADSFESGTGSAALGGTTTVVCFAAQHKGKSLTKVVEDYHALAAKGAIIDYALHMILADPTATVLQEELPPLVKSGHSSIKLFMTYAHTKVDDEQLLDTLVAARENRALVCVHAENNGMISWMGRRLVERGYTAPKYHGPHHPRLCETEAIYRLAAFSELVDQPVIVYHVSTDEGARVIRDARSRGVKMFGETCTQYLTLTVDDLDKPGIDGAKWVCSPPLRWTSDQEALWQALDRGDLQFISSDHAPYRFDDTGKLRAGPNPSFKETANGMPGLELRLPLLFDAMVSKGRYGVNKFVEWTSTAPAKMYGLHPRKGSIAIGGDADICIWDTSRRTIITDDTTHDNAGYSPYAGRTIVGWPVTVLRRGAVIAGDGALKGSAGSGQFLPRAAGDAAVPTGRLSPEFDETRNFGAKLY